MNLEEIQGREARAVRIDTVDGPVEGRLHVTPKLRTLDDLNLVSRRFIMVQVGDPLCIPGGHQAGEKDGHHGDHEDSQRLLLHFDPLLC